MKTNKPETTKRLSDVTRENSTKKVNRFADSLMPVAPKPRVDPPEKTVAPVETEVVNQQPPESVAQEDPKITSSVSNLTHVPAPPRPERARKSGGFSVEDVISGSAREGDVFNKMVRVTDDHHELLRLMAFKYRKPMNVIVHNLIAMLDQAYQKEQKGGQNDV